MTDADLVEDAARQGVADVDGSMLARALYSSDASLYRVSPLVVVRPRHVDELAAVLAVARETATPLTMRGAGTSIAGNAVGTGIVVDTSRHLGRVRRIDPEARTAVVQPGTVHATLQREAARHGLRFGPDPSTHTRCTIGGMVGNNACGSRALGYGRTSDNVVGLDVLTAAGDVCTRRPARPRSTPSSTGSLSHHPTELGRFTRQVSGYSLEQLLPENGRDLDRFLVGQRGDPRRGHRGDRPARRGRAGPGAGRARLPGHGRGGRRGARRCCGTPSWPARASTPASSTWCPRPRGPSCPGARAGCCRGDRRTPRRRRRRPRPPWRATPAPSTTAS